MTIMLRRLAFFALLSVFMTIPSGCAHIDADVKDVQACVAQDGPQFVKDLEQAAGPTIETILTCEADAPTPATDVPMCVEQGLDGLAMSLGPDGERFVMCVENKIENDPDVAAVARARAKAHLAKKAKRS